jgi:glutamine amidotransferase
MIAIIDYGLGNILAFCNVYRRLDIAASVAKNPDDIRSASKLILPGVGAFDHAMQLLDRSGMRGALDEVVLSKRVPVLGICVGMQILAASSEEGSLPGLGWVDGEVKKFDVGSANGKLPLPHMGWNDVSPSPNSGLFKGLENDARFYFLHSYYFQCARSDDVLAQTDYGGRFSSAIHSKNIYGVQFHPEKSHHFGTQLLRNFAEL